MPRFAANLSLLYPHLPFLERFGAAAADGFQAVEYLFPYAYPAQLLQQQLQRYGLQQVLFNAPPGGANLAAMAQAWDGGWRGTLCLPGQEAVFQAGIHQALAYAQVLQCPRIHVMAGLVPQGVSPAVLWETACRNLAWAAQEAAESGVQVLVEPINHRDMPGYYLQYQAQAHDLVQALQASNAKVQMDLYHCQIMEGDVTTKLRQYVPTGRVAHIQVAGVPQRHEPDVGELHYPYVWQVLDELGYDGWVGCEYRPRQDTSAGLRWMPRGLSAVPS